MVESSHSHSRLFPDKKEKSYFPSRRTMLLKLAHVLIHPPTNCKLVDGQTLQLLWDTKAFLALLKQEFGLSMTSKEEWNFWGSSTESTAWHLASKRNIALTTQARGHTWSQVLGSRIHEWSSKQAMCVTGPVSTMTNVTINKFLCYPWRFCFFSNLLSFPRKPCFLILIK